MPTMTTTRTEAVKINFELDAALTGKFKDELNTIMDGSTHWAHNGGMLPGDVLKLSYGFYINYFGKVEACLRAVAKLLEDKDVVVGVDVEELRHGECLILRIGELLKEVQIKLEERKQ